MIADAYGYAESGGSHYSQEIDTLNKIDRFGVHAVMGRPVLYEREIRRMTVASNLVSAYRERAKSTNWVEWASSNKAISDLLIKAKVLYDG